MPAVRVLIGTASPMFRSIMTGLIGDSDDVCIIDPREDLTNKNGDERNGENSYDVLLIEGFANLWGSPEASIKLPSSGSSAPDVSIVAVEDRGNKAVIFRRSDKDFLFNHNKAGLIDAIKRAAGQS